MVVFSSSRGIMKLLLFVCALIERSQCACHKPLGMEDGSIKDNQITSLNWLYQSENFNAYYKAKFARLNNKKLGGGGWCSASIERFSGAYIEIDLLKNTKLTALATQGRGIGSEYIDEYGITYKREKDTKYREYRERGRWHIFSGNNDSHTVVRNAFKYPIIARRIRIIPQGDLFPIYCGRFEIYGCPWKKQKDGLVSYQLLLANDMQGKRTTDESYDGATSSLLSVKGAGLGKLTDDNYGTSVIGTTLSSNWIAYRKKTKFSPFFLFDFETKRRFSAIKFHMLNKGSNIKVFSRVQILFSDDRRKFGKEATYFTSAAERLSSAAFVITVPLNHVVAKFIKCVFTQPKEWMLFSEVDFTSVSPDSPMPTRAPLRTEKPTVVVTEREETTQRIRTTPTTVPTPRLIFSLPISITNFEVISKIQPKSEPPTEYDTSQRKDTKPMVLEPSSSSERKGSLSFPIIIAIVLGAIVISAIVAVLIVRKIRKMGKEKRRPKSADESLVRQPKQNPESNELLEIEKHQQQHVKQQQQPIVVFRSNGATELSTKLILDSGYTSHGSGGSVREGLSKGPGSPV